MQFSVENYPVPPLKALLGQVLSAAFFIGLAVAFVGKSMLPAAAQDWIANNSMLFYGALFVANMVGNSLAQTGAFEVFVDGKLVHSKLKTGGLPDARMLASLIEQALATTA